MRKFIASMLVVLMLPVVVWAVSTTTTEKNPYGLDGTYKIAFANITATGSTTAVILPQIMDKVTCDFLVTGVATDRTTTLQSSFDNSQFEDKTDDITIDPSDTDTLGFDIRNRGMRWVRFNVSAGTMGVTSDIQPTCYFYN